MPPTCSIVLIRGTFLMSQPHWKKTKQNIFLKLLTPVMMKCTNLCITESSQFYESPFCNVQSGPLPSVTFGLTAGCQPGNWSLELNSAGWMLRMWDGTVSCGHVKYVCVSVLICGRSLCYHGPWKTSCTLETSQASRSWLAARTLKTWITLQRERE